MKSIDYCYWLQGWLDLEKPTFIDIQQTQLIKTNLETVFKNDSTPNSFCSFLKGYLVISQPETIEEPAIKIIQQYLESSLLNNIVNNLPIQQPSYPSNQLNPGNIDGLIRC
jgi:hypothetical protein